VLWVSVSLEGSESRVEPEVLWVGCECRAVFGECESVERASKQGRGRVPGGKPEGYVETTAGEKGDVETTARESLPAPRQSGAKEHQLADRASTR